MGFAKIKPGTSFQEAKVQMAKVGIILTRKQNEKGEYFCYAGTILGNNKSKKHKKMDNSEHILLCDLRNRLSKRMNYNIDLNKFDVLLYGWYVHEHIPKKTYTLICKRKWMSERSAVSLSKYAGYDLL